MLDIDTPLGIRIECDADDYKCRSGDDTICEPCQIGQPCEWVKKHIEDCGEDHG